MGCMLKLGMDTGVVLEVMISVVFSEDRFAEWLQSMGGIDIRNGKLTEYRCVSE